MQASRGRCSSVPPRCTPPPPTSRRAQPTAWGGGKEEDPDAPLVMTAALISKGSGLQPVPEHDLDSLPEAPRSSDPMVRPESDLASAVSSEETPAPEADESSPTSPA